MPLDQTNAGAALAAACSVVGLDAAGAELIRLGSNAIFRLRARPVVVRIGTFADVYGYDIMAWPGYPALRDVREFLMVAWLSQNAAHDPEVAAELSARISDPRTGASRRGWKPF